MKIYFKRRDYKIKLGNLAEYYKYYKDLPRLHIQKIENLVRKHHDSKRVMEYYKLKKLFNV